MSWFTDKKVLVPIDFSKESHEAVDTALEMVSSASNVHILHVAPDLAVASPEVVWDAHSDETRRKHIENSFHEKYRADKYRELRIAVSFGDPGHGIAEYAEAIAADMVVMPSHGRTGLKRLLIGSVAERVIRLAHCPVLVLRH